MGQIEDAMAAHEQARADITRAEQQARELVAAARRRAEEMRRGVWAAIVAEAEAGVPQMEIVRRTGMARESIRRILRRGGIEAD